MNCVKCNRLLTNVTNRRVKVCTLCLAGKNHTLRAERTKKSKMPAETNSNSMEMDTEDLEGNEAQAVYKKYKTQRRKILKCKDVLAGELGSFTVAPELLCNDYLYKVGDIVSLNDDGCKYYAQIRGLMQDLFSEKYAAIIWLLPTSETDLDYGFDPNTFTYGPQEQSLYNLRELRFVMHPPTAYYKRFINALPPNTEFCSTQLYGSRPTKRSKR